MDQNQKITQCLKKIVESVQSSRPRGWHLYPTKLRDEAVGVLKEAGVELKDYYECESSTEQAYLFDPPSVT